MTKTEILEQLAAKQREYISFLGKGDGFVGYLVLTKNWNAPASATEEAKKLQAEIAQLEKDVDKLSDPDDYVRGIAKINQKDRAALVEKLNKRTSPVWNDEENFYVTIEGGDLFLNYVSDDGEYEHDWWLKPTVKFEHV